MIDQILRILLQNNVPEDVVDATMDTLIIGLMGKLSPEDKRRLKREMEEFKEEMTVAEA